MKDGLLISSKAQMCIRTHTHTRPKPSSVKISRSALANHLHGGRIIVQSTEYEDITGPPNPEI